VSRALFTDSTKNGFGKIHLLRGGRIVEFALNLLPT
jgi:hypothetical protein